MGGWKRVRARPVTLAAVLVAATITGCISTAPQPTPSAPPSSHAPQAVEAPSFWIAWDPRPPVEGEMAEFEIYSDDAHAVRQVLWDFGDGTSVQGLEAQHAYRDAGTFAVTATIDGGSWITTARADVTVYDESGQAPPPRTEPDVEPPGDADHATADNETPAPPPIPAPLGMPADAPQNIIQLFHAVEEAAATGSPVQVPAIRIDTFLGFDDFGSPGTASLILEESDLFPESAFVEVDGRPIPRPFIRVYEGHRVGEQDDLARLVITGYWARGTIRDGDGLQVIRVNFDENAPIIPGGPRPVPHGNGTAPPRSPEPVSCPGGVDAWAPTPALASDLILPGRSTLPPITARLVMDGDERLVRTLGLDAIGTLVAMAVELDAIYDHNVAIRHQIAGVHLNTDPSYYPDPEVRAPHDQMGRFWDNYHRGDRDIVHLVTGYDSSFAQANCIGGAGHTAGYTFTPYPWELRYAVFHTNAFAHELGHIYAAHHHYGNHVESELATIMIQGYTPGAQPKFSTLSKMVIRGWAEQNL